MFKNISAGYKSVYITFGISLFVHIRNVQILNDLHRYICLSIMMPELNIQYARK